MNLPNLPIQGCSRLRGREITRLEAFVKASFALSPAPGTATCARSLDQ